MFFLTIDIRETDVYNKMIDIQSSCTSNKFTILSSPLDIGDILISDKNKVPVLIIERKTIADLSASIKDGRYTEQSFRLNGNSVHNHNIVYLIEGNIQSLSKNKFNKHRINEDMIYSAIFSLQYYKGFSVIKTLNCDETVKMLCTMMYKLEKEHLKKMPYYTNKLDSSQSSSENECCDNSSENIINDKPTSSTIDDSLQYACVVKSSKKANITTDNIGAIMLCQIPLVSTVIATTIMTKYKNIQSLIKRLEVDPECLKNMTYINTKGRETKISKTSIANIISFLMIDNNANNEEIIEIN
jgi:ERCC4-type nuclease